MKRSSDGSMACNGTRVKGIFPRFVFVACFLLVLSCGKSDRGRNDTASGESTPPPGGQTAPLPAVPPPRYHLRTAVLETVVETRNPSSRTTVKIIIADSGRLELRDTRTTLGGQRETLEGKTLIRDGMLYTLNVKNKSFTRMSLEDPRNMDFDFSRILSGKMPDLTVKEIGRQTVAGFPCTIYRMTSEKTGLQGKFWVWNNLQIKADYTVGNYAVRTRTLSVRTETDVKMDVFNIPEDYRLETMSQPPPPL
ncbi:MAG: DUF4412 domain-containing protein [Bacteroidota bacterium]|nr:DUF4412 domain-containing protein [Bacteroidota bacterium]